MSVRSDVLLWAHRIVAKKAAPPHELLEIDRQAGFDAAQAAFHRIARMAHPDLHRTTLSAEELELVTSAYSKVAGAFQQIRSQRGQQASAHTQAERTSPQVSPPAAARMSSKALVYYRKAELCLRRGDLRGAILQLKMAIAADPQSAFLRTALGEVEAEGGKR